MASRQFGPYRLVRQIAVGGMAEIHLAKTKGIAGFEKYVALKMIHPNLAEDEQFIQMLVDEAKIAVQLNHGNIAQTFDLGRVGETFYITMEYVDGADLYKILRRSSELEIQMPLDVCAFVSKEVLSALDHAHRKRDHLGKPLGIVHRDVSPQNVLISYAGEVKLVDFGIAKATMKARQTAAGVIKGKYYYMSPEQAWGDPVDRRSDVFSAGIVLYEMLAGQMLYLEEDLHKLLDMARRAEIAPPSTLRKGIPPQLERIVMRALARAPAERYQSAGELASDLERFLHAYSPGFTAAKLASLLKRIVGEAVSVSEETEVRDGQLATHTLNTADLIHDKDELHDENSVIFRLDALQPQQLPRPSAEAVGASREPDLPDNASPRPQAKARSQTKAPAEANTAIAPVVPALPVVPAKVGRVPTPSDGAPRARPRPRHVDEPTRQVGSVPTGPDDDSSLSMPLAAERSWESATTHPGRHDLDAVGDRTTVTATPNAMRDFMSDVSDVSDVDGVDATMVTPPERHDIDEGGDGVTLASPPPIVESAADHDAAEEDGPTIQRDFRDKPRAVPAALGGKIHAPVVSDLRKPRASRKTPPAGANQSNALHAIVGAQPREPMPSPPRSSGTDEISSQQPAPLPAIPSYGNPARGAEASDLQSGTPVQFVPDGRPALPSQPSVQSHAAPYSSQGYPQLTPGSLYQLHGPAPTAMSLTDQMRLLEVDEVPAQFRVLGGMRWLKLAIAGVAAVSAAALVTFVIVRAMREPAASGSIRVQSVPPGAEITYDGTHMAQPTPLTIEAVPTGTRHEIRIALAHHETYVETVEVPRQGGVVPMMAALKAIAGSLSVDSHPSGAEIRIDGQVRGHTPTTINDIDPSSATTLELRLKDYQPVTLKLDWPANNKISIDQMLNR